MGPVFVADQIVARKKLIVVFDVYCEGVFVRSIHDRWMIVEFGNYIFDKICRNADIRVLDVNVCSGRVSVCVDSILEVTAIFTNSGIQFTNTRNL